MCIRYVDSKGGFHHVRMVVGFVFIVSWAGFLYVLPRTFMGLSVCVWCF